jgi:hypothetical protein
LFLSAGASLAGAPKVWLVNLFEEGGMVHAAKRADLPGKNAEWVGLEEGKDGFRLVSISMKYDTPYASECVEGFGMRMSPIQKRRLRFAVSGTSLQPGPVVTTYSGTAELAPGKRVRVDPPTGPCKDDQCYELAAQGKWKNLEEGIPELEGYFLTLSYQGKRTRIFTQSKYFAQAAQLYWAGDLDGDKKLDLILNTHYSQGSFGQSLYLSSAAGPGEMVRLVASHNPESC